MRGIWKEWGDVGEEWKSVLGCGGVRGRYWECRGRCGRVYGVSVEVVENWGKCVVMWEDVEKCVKRYGGSPHFVLHLPNTSPHTPTLT